MPRRALTTRSTISQDFAMVALALVSVMLLLFEVTAEFTVQQLRVIEAFDVTIALVFLSEYIVSVVRSRDRWRYAWTHWYELLAAIPITSQTTQLLRGLRLFRLVRILRVVRLAARFAILYRQARQFAQHTRMVAILLISLLMLFLSAAIFYLLEANSNPHVTTFFDGMWWALVTITTVGYGDVVPMTGAGRVVAVLLMLFGIAILGTLTAGIASYVWHAKERSRRKR
ncbi:MAG: potassium channel family protein [Candidatus Kerfeldbacteria bacterium]|nr:potassium channel family protein [Candidatus Kerfeldbacteria bacterium]